MEEKEGKVEIVVAEGAPERTEEPKKAEKKETKPRAKKAPKKAEEATTGAPAETPAEQPTAAAAPTPATEAVQPETAPEEKREPEKWELVFGRFPTKDVKVEDPSLKAFINLDPAYVPHKSARHGNKPFHKHKLSIVERLINNLMRTEKYTGKKTKSYTVVLDAFMIVQERTKENPIQVFVKAIEHAAPREEVTRLKFGGISVPKAVDTAPSRRVDIALRNISLGTVKASHKNKKTIAQCLATELMAAAKNDLQSFAVAKRDESERVAKSAH
jgi:small subunit ribosomal protein S7